MITENYTEEIAQVHDYAEKSVDILIKAMSGLRYKHNDQANLETN